MQTYSEKSAQVVFDSSIAVMVISNEDCTDIEMLPVKPCPAPDVTESMCEELKARWPGRGLRSVGVIGLCGLQARSALKEPLSPRQVDALSVAFLAYVQTLLQGVRPEHVEQAEIAELHRLYALHDPRGEFYA